MHRHKMNDAERHAIIAHSLCHVRSSTAASRHFSRGWFMTQSNVSLWPGETHNMGQILRHYVICQPES